MNLFISRAVYKTRLPVALVIMHPPSTRIFNTPLLQMSERPETLQKS